MDPITQLATLRESMLSTGLLDEQFRQLLSLQDPSDPGLVPEIIALFCDDGERIIAQLSTLLEKPTVDFGRVDAYVHQLKGSSASVGVQKVKNTCLQFRGFCQQRNKEGCLKVLDIVRTEFYEVRGKFQIMLQLEREVRNLFPKK